MLAALKQPVDWHPVRPEDVMPSSPSVDRLREVLGSAPNRASAEDKSADTRYYMVLDDDGFTGAVTCYWNDAFLQDLFQALIAVIEEHGILGWENVRWEVYDKVSRLPPQYSGKSRLMSSTVQIASVRIVLSP